MTQAWKVTEELGDRRPDLVERVAVERELEAERERVAEALENA